MMRIAFKYFLLTLVLQVVTFNLWVQQVPMTISGTFQGRDIYVKNPYRNEKVGFCVSKVTVNGDVTTDEINSSSFEIDLGNYKFLNGDKVEVIIYHDKDCTPKVMNPEALTPKSTYVIEEINVDGEDNLVWKTTGETGELDYIVEQFKWNEWNEIGRVSGTGSPSLQSYKFKVLTHSGENKFRVHQKDFTGKKRVSPDVVYNASKPKITFYPKKVRKDIVFSGETSYKILDRFGNPVEKGKGTTIDCSNLKKGFYYLNYDNETATFNKK